MLVVEHLNKRYPRGESPGESGSAPTVNEVVALDDVHFNMEQGQFLAIQGRSGSGKSTLLLVVAGMLRPDSGTVRLGEVDLYQLTPRERAGVRAARIGMVFQQFHLLPYLTVLQNVLLPQLAAPAAEAHDRARSLIDQFGLSSRADHIPAELSTGERQRVALARALLPRPAILLADEPTGNLDRESAGVVLNAMRSFAEQGGAVLLVTHDAEAASQADATYRMEAGRLQSP